MVVNEMKTVTLKHVMAESQINLNKTWESILKLSNGDINEIRRLVNAAKLDFRDVIYWANLQDEKFNT